MTEPSPVPDAPASGKTPDHRVLAVVVAHDGASWLPRALEALTASGRRPDRVVAVDTGSTDATAELLRASAVVDDVLAVPRATGFAAAVALGVEQGDRQLAPRPTPAGDTERVDWVWVLHDDVAPDPGALTALLAAATDAPSLAVLGPKVVGWDDPRRLLEVGLTVTAAGRRETGLERQEQDQGQHDDQQDVLAVGSAGMLVRRDVWDQLGGFDPHLPLFADDLDLGWRAQLAGHRVGVVTEAVVHHAEAAARGRRAISAGARRTRRNAHRVRVARASSLYVMLVNASPWSLPWRFLRLVVGSLMRVLVLLLGKVPSEAIDELAALGSVLVHPLAVLRGRRRRRRLRSVPARHLHPLFPAPGHQVRQLVETLAGAVTSAVSAPAATSAESGPVDEESEDFGEGGSGWLVAWFRRPAVLLTLALLVASLAAWRSLYTGGELFGGALLPVPTGAADLWSSVTATWQPVGPGSPETAPAWLAGVAVLATVMLGKAPWAVAGLLLLAVPLAGVFAYAALGPLGLSQRLRIWGAAGYALTPALTVGIAQGRLGTAVLAMLLPLFGLAVVRTVGTPDRAGTVRGAATAALLLSVVVAFAPVGWLLAAALLVPGLVLFATHTRARLRLAAVLVAPLVLLMPWSLRLFTEPTLWWFEAGQPLPAQGATEPWRALVLDPGGAAAAPWWLGVGLLLAGLVALVRLEASRLVRVGAAMAGLGLVVGVVQSAVTVTAPSASEPLAPWPGPALVVASAGLVLAATRAARRARGRLSQRGLGWRQPAVLLVALVAALTPVMVAGWWVARGVADPLQRGNPDPLPAFVAAAAEQPERVRTLVLAQDGDQLRYALLRDREARLGEGEVVAPAADLQGLSDLVGEMASGRGGDAVAELARYAVKYVLVTAPVEPSLAGTLDSVPGLFRIANPGQAALWRLEATTGRLQLTPPGDQAPLVLPSGEVSATATVPAAPTERLLTLAERSDAGWRAAVAGRQLPTQTVAGWAQGFVVAPAAGVLAVSHQNEAHQRWLTAQGIAVLLVVVLALPGRRRDVDVVG